MDKAGIADIAIFSCIIEFLTHQFDGQIVKGQ